MSRSLATVIPLHSGGDTRPAPLAVEDDMDREAVAQLKARYGRLTGTDLIAGIAHEAFPGQFAVVSSFGSESAVLLDEKAARVAGKMAVLAQTPSPLFVGGTGELLGRKFSILGRVRYGYERGYWDEWYLAFDDGSTAWVGEDENNFALESHDDTETAPIEYADAFPGQTVQLGETAFHLDEKGIAICEGGEVQLPFTIVSGERVPFLDLSLGDKFATVEYDIEDQTARVFRGRRLDISDLRMDYTAEEAGATGGLRVERGADGDRR